MVLSTPCQDGAHHILPWTDDKWKPGEVKSLAQRGTALSDRTNQDLDPCLCDATIPICNCSIRPLMSNKGKVKANVRVKGKVVRPLTCFPASLIGPVEGHGL